MQKSHHFWSAMSLFGVATKRQQEISNENPQKQRLFLTVVTAFFVIIAAGLIFQFTVNTLEARQVSAFETEAAAFQPASPVSAEIFKGYASK